ncbi:MarR family transcriptional regulator [Calidifontibacter sp. DB0510]|uniref:MarR family transcriptional regulator n=1 Tax=Metallococcus carri TaxID=1656884 RepID=A0A967B732_9MICO|nr:MarR family transcriptional regulator [Metallococcus carri]NHN56772.1 MarR family transcriptional regulator [Metallococcus carri]NOP37851.1 MarR family transcriptional regulator [Calidifontibacter sp. DB2511S]
MSEQEVHHRSEADELVTALLTASRVLVGVSARSLAGVADTLTVTQFRCLVVLSNTGTVRLNQLADALGVNASTALRTVDRLIAQDLVDRKENPANRREVLITLTPTGAAVVHDVTERRRADIGGIVRRMPVTRRRELIRALRTFSDAAGEPEAAPSTPW